MTYEEMGQKIHQIVAMRRDSFSTKQIAEKVDLSPGAVAGVVSALLKHSVVERRSSSNGFGSKAKTFVEQNLEALQESYKIVE